jgi:hypothetical protein
MIDHTMDAAFSLAVVLELLVALVVGFPLFTAADDYLEERRFQREHRDDLRRRWR